MDSDQIAALMLGYDRGPVVQESQTRFRSQIVNVWGIEPGTRVLEIGCGQGDLTAVLADAVGPTGRVLAVDPAPMSYGAPLTVGESTDYLRRGPFGDRLEFRFDWVAESFDVVGEPFDYVVLGHCSWYFDSIDRLRWQLAAATGWGSTLCFSEWDMRPRTIAQVPHYLAVLALGQFEPWEADRTGLPSTGNIRTPLSRPRATALIRDAGWTVVAEQTVDSSGLQDAGWEIGACEEAAEKLAGSGLPSLMSSQFDVLTAMADSGEIASLDSYAVVANRSG